MFDRVLENVFGLDVADMVEDILLVAVVAAAVAGADTEEERLDTCFSQGIAEEMKRRVSLIKTHAMTTGKIPS